MLTGSIHQRAVVVVMMLTALLLALTPPCISATCADPVNNAEIPDQLMVTLPDLERRLTDPDELAAAAADLEAGMAQLERQRDEQGLKLFAGASAGYTTDTSLPGSARNYTTWDIRAGLRYPLLGRAAAEARGVVETETSVLEREQRVELARRQSLALLRRQYVGLWAAGEKLRLTDTFLAEERQQTELLNRRQREGYLLTSDYLEMLTAFDLARRQRDQLQAGRSLALRTIMRLAATGCDLIASPPDLPEPLVDREQLRTTVTKTHPAVTMARERLNGLERQAALIRCSGTGANIDLFTASGNDDALNDPEYTIGMAVGIELPVGRLLAQENQELKAIQALVTKARHEHALAGEQVRMQAEEALALYLAAGADLALANRRLAAAEAGVRERQMRTAMEGDTLEQLHRAKSLLYQAGLDRIDALTRGWSHQITLLEYAPMARAMGSEQPPAMTPSAVSTPSPPLKQRPVNSLYVWQSERFQELASADPAFLASLHTDGIDRLLLSLNGEQVARLEAPAVRQAYGHWLRTLQEKGFRTELLLGEPLWMLPKHRVNLMAILVTLAELPFTGLHLDIEPHQLTPAQRRGVDERKEWLATVQAAKNISPWPLAVSVHPRYFRNDKDGWPDLGPALAQAGVSEVMLMIYASNPDRVRDLAVPILKAWPGLRFAVAQSVEPELARSASHYHAGRKRFAEKMDRLAGYLGLANFTGLVIQDWNHWQEMQP